MSDFKKYARAVLNILIPLVTIYLVCIWGPRVLRFFLPFVIGWIIALIANPPVRFLERRLKIVRKHSSIVIVVSVLALIIGLLYLLISKLITEAAGFINDIPVYYETASAEVQNIFQQADRFMQFLPQDVRASASQFFSNIGEYLNLVVEKIASPTVTAAGNVVKSIPAVMVNTIVTVISSYLFIAERERILEMFHRYIPSGGFLYYSHLKKDVKHLIGGYFLAQFKIMFVVAAVMAAGLLILGVDYALLLAVCIALLDFLPIFGTGTVLIPWALIRLLSGQYAFAFGLAAIYVLSQVLRQVIQPKIVGDTMGLNPLMTLLFLYLGFKVSGLAGMILAVPVGMLFLNLYKFGAFDGMIDGIKTLADGMNRFRRGADEGDYDEKK